jgi:hypothetical protein
MSNKQPVTINPQSKIPARQSLWLQAMAGGRNPQSAIH